MLGFFIAWMLISYTQSPNKQGLPPSLTLGRRYSCRGYISSFRKTYY